jgi:pimeloyl-ACP methyl ester carboxylesterase
MTAPVTVFDGQMLRASLFAGDRAQLMVTLDYRKTGKADFSPPHHSTSFARMRYAQLSIKTRRNDWFINPETEALEQALVQVAAGYDRVHILGYSMGGYGAFRFARAMGAASVVAISPQVSIHPGVVPFDRRYRAEGRGFDPVLGDLATRADPALQGLLIFDPFVATDLRHAQMLQDLFPRLRLVRLGFGGHPAIRVLREAAKSWTLHREASALKPTPQLILHGHRAGRRQSAGYWARLAKHAERRHPAVAAYARAQVMALGGAPPENDAMG